MLLLKQAEDQQVEGAAMLVYADLDVECLKRRNSHAQPRGNYVPTQYADIDFSRPAGMDRAERATSMLIKKESYSSATKVQNI